MSQKIKQFLTDQGVVVSSGDELNDEDRTNLVHVLHLRFGVLPYETLYGLAYPGVFPENIRNLLFGESDEPEEPVEPTPDPEPEEPDNGGQEPDPDPTDPEDGEQEPDPTEPEDSDDATDLG